MQNFERVKAFKKLYSLLIFYSENRDQPVEEGFNFLEEVKDLCHTLDLDYKTFIKEMHLDSFID